MSPRSQVTTAPPPVLQPRGRVHDRPAGRVSTRVTAGAVTCVGLATVTVNCTSPACRAPVLSTVMAGSPGSGGSGASGRQTLAEKGEPGWQAPKGRPYALA